MFLVQVRIVLLIAQLPVSLPQNVASASMDFFSNALSKVLILSPAEVRIAPSVSALPRYRHSASSYDVL